MAEQDHSAALQTRSNGSKPAIRSVSFVQTAWHAYLYRTRRFMMGASSGFPIDLILFGMIAAFLVLRLRSILGRRTGYERPAQPYQPPTAAPANGPVIDAQAEAAPGASRRQIPEPASALGQTMARMSAVDSSFNPNGFLDGAEKAFRMIVTAFAAADRPTLRGLLGPDTYAAFDSAVTAREQAGHVQISEIRGIESSSIEAAELKGSVASVSVKFVSDQISLTQDANGRPIAGTDAVTEITDIWTFERDLSSRDPTWRLVAARSA
jgi:predicted lipid-binding transport protein (Tim44 family)